MRVCAGAGNVRVTGTLRVRVPVRVRALAGAGNVRVSGDTRVRVPSGGGHSRVRVTYGCGYLCGCGYRAGAGTCGCG